MYADNVVHIEHVLVKFNAQPESYCEQTLYKFALLLMCSEQLAEENLCNFHSVLLHYILTVLNMPTYTVYIDAVAHTGYAILKCSMNL